MLYKVDGLRKFLKHESVIRRLDTKQKKSFAQILPSEPKNLSGGRDDCNLLFFPAISKISSRNYTNKLIED
jgi:hypothetical protein